MHKTVSEDKMEQNESLAKLLEYLQRVEIKV